MDKELIENLRQAIETTAVGIVEDIIHAAGGTVEGRVRDGLITCNDADGEIVYLHSPQLTLYSQCLLPVRRSTLQISAIHRGSLSSYVCV